MSDASKPLTRLLLLGCGLLGARVLRLAQAAEDPRERFDCSVTTRDASRVGELTALGARVLVMPELSFDALAHEVTAGTGLIVSFPPDGHTDARCAKLAAFAHSTVYVSSTGVYGATSGSIDGSTPAAPDSERTRRRLEAEQAWRSQSATVLRAAAIYGPFSGMHTRLRAGSARIAGDGAGYVCRIHVEDLARLCLGCLTQRVGPETLLAADQEPAPQGEVVRYLAARLGMPVPPSVPLEQVPETLRHDRRIDASATWGRLNLRLRYPTYREGFEACLAEETSGETG